MNIFLSRKKPYGSLTVLITGANGAVGWQLVCRCLLSGDMVIALDSHERPIEPAKKLLYYQADMSDAKRLDDIVELVAVSVGGIVDVIINLAAVCDTESFGCPPVPLMELEDRVMTEAFHVNVLGPWRASKAFLPLLKRSRCPAVLNVSIESVMKQPGFCCYPYAGTKMALDTLTRSMRMELSGVGIDVVCCTPPTRESVVYRFAQYNTPHLIWRIITLLLRWSPCAAADAAKDMYDCIHSQSRPTVLDISQNPFMRFLNLILPWLPEWR
eukprot:GEMP01022158.1.p1 GENE.GEMP01022158.1~~GEMP01022158.1.p1  ORF type:complete len:270 (+),score=51.58 GEMP01022158.1:316-1125(+)